MHAWYNIRVERLVFLLLNYGSAGAPSYDKFRNVTNRDSLDRSHVMIWKCVIVMKL